MFTSLECIPCFFRQLLKTVRAVAPGDESLHRRAVQGWACRLADERLSDSPPAVAGRMYGFLSELTGRADMFAEDKRRANAQALELLPAMRALCTGAPAPLKRALEVSVIGNYMDSGTEFQGDWEREIANLDESLDAKAFEDFAAAVDAGGEVLILGDNAGEIVLDMLLVEELVRRGAKVVYAVRGGPSSTTRRLRKPAWWACATFARSFPPGSTPPEPSWSVLRRSLWPGWTRRTWSSARDRATSRPCALSGLTATSPSRSNAIWWPG